MAYESIKIHDIVDRAVSHKWSIPEFQRGFVWKATQVRDLAESLWRGYPIGSLLVWESKKAQQEKFVNDPQNPGLWVVDGQQRATALCILFGRRPYWWADGAEWEDVLTRYDMRFDVDAKEPPFFVTANAAIRKVKGDRYIPLNKLLVLDIEDNPADQRTLENLAASVNAQGFCQWMSMLEVYTRLDRVRKIRNAEVVTITVDQELEDVVEIFSRLNSKGTRVTEADIYLGVVAARAKGWVHDEFMGYLEGLKDYGFDVDPNLLFRSLTAIGAKKVRFRDIADDFWNQASIGPAWKKTTLSWKRMLSRFREYGILSNDPMPTQTALVTMSALVDKFPDAALEPALYWFLQASRFGRYSGSSATSLEEDLRDIAEAISLPEAVQKLLHRWKDGATLEPDEFLRDYSDARFGRFLLYLLAYRNKAQDWDEEGDRLGFEGAQVLSDFRPQWHHIFPRKYLLSNGVPENKADALANIAVIGPNINIRISDKSPMDYITRYQITPAKLGQQFIDTSVQAITPYKYESWLQERALRLAIAGNEFLDELRKGL